MSEDVTIPVHVPVAEAGPDAHAPKQGLRFSRTWTCTSPVADPERPGETKPCGARLSLHTEHDHANGPSNFVAHTDAKRIGHSKLLLSELTWEGMREERGWVREGDDIKCPACQAGLTVAEFKVIGRRREIEKQIASLQAQLQE